MNKRPLASCATAPSKPGRFPTSELFPVIAVGASAGALEAFTRFLDAFPPKSGTAILFVQHLDPAHESMMVKLLGPHTNMPVHEALDGTKIERDNVYVIAPGTYLAVQAGALIVSEPKERHGARMPFDHLLRTLAESYGDRAIAVILSGNGTDGSLGLKSVSDRGGLIVVQDPAEAAHKGMPQSAIATGVIDLVLPLEKIPASLTSYAKQMRLFHKQEEPGTSADEDQELYQITDLLRAHATLDFSAYKPGTLLRRIRRRMAIHGISEVATYLVLLHDEAKEIDSLARDLLIHVTGFFRDPNVFELLATKVVPDLIRDHPMDQPLRVWVPACSTGEEVYSLAMILIEEITATRKNLKLQIFGTDIDEQAVQTARIGKYPASLKSEISPARLERFFLEEAEGYRIATSVRESVIFTVQDILTDPPFARIDLVSCRNLLIYLLPDAQHRVLSLVHFSLRKGGIMLLGIAESPGALRDDFEAVREDMRIYRRVGTGRKLNLQFGPNNKPRAFWPRPQQAAPERAINPGDIAQQLLLESYAPASVLINHKQDALHYFGPTDNYLQIPTGDASHGLLAMARLGIRNQLRTALQRARRENALAVVPGGEVSRNGVSFAVRVEVRPVHGAEKDMFLVSFTDLPRHTPSAGTSTSDSASDSSKVNELEKIVEGLQRELQDIGRELEISSADQESINEDAQSLNEEFQSTNEELETSKEELQSLNEELNALNAQLTATVNQQRHTADDLENILRSSELAIVFLDSNLNIRFFSSAAKSLFNTIETDLGRPMGDLAHRFDDPDLVSDIRSVLKTLTAVSREVRSHSGDWFARGVLPYRTRAGISQGVVLTFVNISVMKIAELKIAAERAYAESVSDTVRQPLVVVDERLRIVSSNSSFRRIFGTTPDGFAGRGLSAVGDGCLDVPSMNRFLDRALAEQEPIEDCEIEIDLPSVGRRVLLLSSRRIVGESLTGRGVLIALDDITERKHVNEALEVAKLKAEKANLGKSRFLAAASHDLRQPLQTLSLLHGVLARKTKDEETLTLIGKLNDTLGAMTGMLDTLLDINQLEAGTVQPEIDDFSIGTVLDHLKTEFTYLAKQKGLSFHVVGSSLRVRSDPLLLAQMIRNLLSNAVKYTKHGKILFGCRRDGDKVRLEIWDTGIGIPGGQLEAIFEEYHQLGNPARERGLGLGLGLSIVQRIGELLDHRIHVRSEAGKGSVFSVELPASDTKGQTAKKGNQFIGKADTKVARAGTLLIIEDDPTVREALHLLFTGEGYRTILASDGIEVSALVQRGALMPDVIVADYNLPGDRTGLEVIKEVRLALRRQIPAIVLTGDIATEVLRKVIAADCGYLRKPVDVNQLTLRIEEIMASAEQPKAQPPQPRAVAAKAVSKVANPAGPIIFLVDDDPSLLDAMREMLEQDGHTVETHPSAESFLSSFHGDRKGCLVVDSQMPGMSGLELLAHLKDEKHDLPSIVITGHGDITMAIKAMQAGAMDFLEKPASPDVVLASVGRALIQAGDTAKRSSIREAAAASIAALTPRERAVLELVVEGLPNKQIAFKLDISQRTVETHRAAVMARTGSGSLPDLIRLVMRAG